MWAEVRAALTYREALNGGAAIKARLALSVIHAEVMLKAAAAIDPINARAVVPQPGPERAAHAGPQALHFGRREAITAPQRMQAGEV